MKADIQVLISPDNSIVRIALPASVTVEDALSYFPSKNKSKISRFNSYGKALWGAFSEPLDDGKDRYIRLHPRIHYEDIDKGTRVGADKIHIDNALVLTKEEDSNEGDGQQDSKIKINIQKWLQTNDIDLNHLRSTSPESKLQESVLEKLIRSLSDAELKRVQMPLDIIEKLLGKK